jgi:tRNA-Thr(GGU) m(6)t(6)A37 methyltransferase TsaA
MTQTVHPDWTFKTIGVVHSPCKEKFAAPRQSGLAPELVSSIEILKPYDRDEAFSQLEGFSHIWVLSVFHLAQRDEWQTTVRPPRLGGNERVGVFASRSPFRPNPIGLSVFKLLGLERKQGVLYIDVAGTDLVDGTPVLDIKPYLEYADKPAGVISGYADKVDKHRLDVEFSPEALHQCRQIEKEIQVNMHSLITQLVSLDPRPAYRLNDKSIQMYGVRLYDYNISFEVVGLCARIISIQAVN